MTKIASAIGIFVAALLGFWMHVGSAFPRPAFVSLALLLGPLWFFGFGLAHWLRRSLASRFTRLLLPALLVVPYLVYAIPLQNVHWGLFLVMVATAIGSAFLVESCRSSPRLTWQDIFVLFWLVAMHLLRLLEPAWPDPRLTAFPKLFLIDVVAYDYLVVRQLDCVGYWLVPTATAFRTGFREWLFFLPFGIGIGNALHFTHFDPHWPAQGQVGMAIVATFLFVAIPEELFFRGILQNLLETRIGRTAALVLASILFGFSHYHRGGTFDWRYILLAAIAGIFYGRAWRARHQLLAAIITHTAVDVVWSIWFR